MAGPAVPPPLLSTPSAAAGFHNASSWYNLTNWAVNVTRYAPSFEDLVWAGPRMFRRLGSFIAVSEPLDGSAAHCEYHYDAPSAGPGLARLAADTNLMDPTGPGAGSDPVTHASRLSMDGARGLGSVFSYATSKWALSCIAMAVILNRTHVFAATRRRLRLRWRLRLALRLLPIILLTLQARSLLRSIQCQTSPDFAQLRWGDASKSSDLMFSHENGFLNKLSSILLLGAADEESCTAVSMTAQADTAAPRELHGSLSLLWPLFGSFCLSHFVETVSCAVQGRPVASETGLTLFEQSLAFAEADAAVSNQLGWGTFSKSRPADSASSSLGSSIALTRSMILKRVNTPPEVLVVAFLTTMTHLTSHVLGVLGLQARYRLVSTGFWGLCFMGSIVWSVFVFDLSDSSTQGLLRYPTVCIIGFAPHVLVVAGIAACLSIYGMALLLSALAPPSNHGLASMSFRQRLAHAHENMQANVSLSEIRVTREMDFYVALARTGLAAISMASEAVYLNEDHGVSLKRHTWLEDARFREAEELQRQWMGMGLPGSRHDQVGAIGLIPVKSGPLAATSGYSRERAAQQIQRGRGERGLRAGIGATERSSRWLMAFGFMLSISRLLLRLGAMALLWVLGVVRIRSRPAWLLWLARRPKAGRDDGNEASKRRQGRRGGISSLPFNDNGRIPRTDGIDVEAEFRRTNADGDEDLDTDLYKYWLKGGWWGSTDSSGDFEPNPADDEWDNTSVVSMSTTGGEGAGDDEDQWASDDSGQRTPTQRSPQRTRESTPVVDSPLNMGDLARLLHPTNTEERDEAQTLSAHLQSGGIMTRSNYRRMEQLKRTRILTASGLGPSSGSGPGPGPGPSMPGRTQKLSADEEERLLEQLLLSRRQASPREDGEPVPWGQGAAGMGEDGPQCVVCQSAPRTIIVWPCRCLSLCDDCRVSLAMNNFDKCVCCRREVVSFSRIFVP